MKKYRVLVVDDLRDSADSLAVLLRLDGHEAYVAYGGEEAIGLAEGVRPDVILLDIGLGKINGYEVCRHIREHPWGQSIFIIAITGWGQWTDRETAKVSGFDHHLVKPVAPDTLFKLLNSLPSGEAGKARD
jgi:CheY-like chemotaxis protein